MRRRHVHRPPGRSALRVLALAGVVAALCACEPHEPRLVIHEGDRTSPAHGLTTRTHALTLDMRTRDGDVVTWGAGLTLEGRVEPPVVDGVTLQATDVQWMGGRLYATYNVRGDRFLGALQVIDAHSPGAPFVVAEAIYRGVDLNRLHVAGTNVFVAGADSDGGGVVDRFAFRQGTLELLGTTVLGSYSATYLALDGYRLYATSGDVDGGVSLLALDGDATRRTGFVPLHDARWVASLGKDAFVAVAGSPGSVSVHEGVGGPAATSRSAAIAGAHVGAPTWARVHRGHLYLSSDDAGLLVYDLADLREVGRLATDGTANGSTLSVDGKLAFLANGEEGLVMVDVLDPTRPRAVAAIDVADDAGSANAVAVRGNRLALADGLGGVKLLRFERRATGPKNDADGDGVPDAADPDDDDDGARDEDDAAPADPDVVCPTAARHVQAAWVGDVHRLPCDHPDVAVPLGAAAPGARPDDHDWFDGAWYAATVGAAVPATPAGDRCDGADYRAVRWRSTAIVSETGDYTLALTAEGDAWLAVDGAIAIDLGGVHERTRATATVRLRAGAHALTLWTAHRRAGLGAVAFEVAATPGATARIDLVQHVCLPPQGDADGDGVPDGDDIAPLVPAPAAGGSGPQR